MSNDNITLHLEIKARREDIEVISYELGHPVRVMQPFIILEGIMVKPKNQDLYLSQVATLTGLVMQQFMMQLQRFGDIEFLSSQESDINELLKDVQISPLSEDNETDVKSGDFNELNL